MSPDHPLLDEYGHFRVGVKVGQLVQIGRDHDEAAWATPLPTLYQTPRGLSTTTAPATLNAELAWWLGALLGDGSMRDRRDGTLEFHAREPELVERFVAVAQAQFGVRARRYPNRVLVISKAVRQWLLALGIDYVTSEHKSVPECIFRSDAACRAAFLQGLFDTDGCMDTRHFLRYVSTSTRLAQGVQQLLDSVGVHETKISSQIPTVTYRGRRREGLRAYTVLVWRKGVGAFAQKVGFSHQAKQRRLRESTKRPVRELPSNRDHGRLDRVVEVVASGVCVPLHDLEVEGDHSFIANGLVVSNTQGLTLDRVQINLRDPFFRMPSMLFVALSRARTIDGLKIIGNQRAFIERCTVEPRVQPWL